MRGYPSATQTATSRKGLHFAGGYRHFQYTLWNWAPSQSDRQTNVEFEKAEGFN